jgi:hypothetical protein
VDVCPLRRLPLVVVGWYVVACGAGLVHALLLYNHTQHTFDTHSVEVTTQTHRSHPHTESTHRKQGHIQAHTQGGGREKGALGPRLTSTHSFAPLHM